ncbi:MAG: desulfoferrodoxin [bacterium]|uniref:Desulfoferrodoxin n=2 Tax=Bacteria candidate phyla TaxID=1783234 RepID=A0A101I3V6_UNCT6|nr:MAG: Desulfoferrodoxin [candidate division TA06 bacterium 32_111]KUK87405.1 MAG: Desulfoferrodoxin [candidate division TA06 bacterium 34_109]MDI6701140.1 desulfoferrodoxin [bacterium]HAF07761.1 desulfoferrodoxin [candidate division WOR-3 bacterium]HCP17279.1 desulfoferrodoxin [candidate division WOR-3 bacterium]
MKTQMRELYRCEVCGNVVEVVNTGMTMLVCCNKPMVKLEAKKEDTGVEKHLPVIEDLGGKIKVKIGSVEHPMEEKHYIVFVEVLTDKKVLRHEFKPGEKPEAIFDVSLSDVKEVREFCNIHMLWAKEVK